MEADQILACQFSAWYLSFSDVAFKSRVIPLPATFLEFLLQDGVFLPEGSHALPRRTAPQPHEDYEGWTEEDPDTEGSAATAMPEFPELMGEIEAAISELGGCVAPKLNWSSPHDAAWVSADKSLACRNADEVVLLLKSSDRVAHDICHAFDACGSVPDQAHVQYMLALRKWVALKPEREFRCFVSARELVAVSQRNVLEHAHGLEAQKQELLEALLEFFEQHVQQRFPLSDYTFDVYLTTAGKVRLIDFNPVFGTTSPLLFDWEELPYEAARPSTAAAAEGVQSRAREQCVTAAQHASPAGAALRACASANGHGQPAGEDPSSCEVQFRFASPDSMLRPNAAVYGAPFELADMSQGGAIDDLLKKLQVEQQES